LEDKEAQEVEISSSLKLLEEVERDESQKGVLGCLDKIIGIVESVVILLVIGYDVTLGFFLFFLVPYYSILT